MSDVSIYVAVITAAAGVAGAAISQVTGALRESRQAKRDREERHATAARQACEKLLRAVGNLRTQVANNKSFRGNRETMTPRLEMVRKYAAAARVHAASVALLVPADVAEEADRLAAAAGSLAEWTEQNTDLDLGAVNGEPDFGDLDRCAAGFRIKAMGTITT
jgi:uncharacterized protein YicC (UPF0701 family)